MLSLTSLTLEFGRLVRFGIVGIVATAVYTAVSLLAIEVLGFSPVAASILGFASSIGVSYYGHAIFSFKVEVDHASYLRRFLVLASASFTMSTGIMWVLADVMNVPHRIAIAILAISIPAFNYVCSRFWLFRAGLSNSASGRNAIKD